eukprot:6177464-Pleurochrysis_carterae.AAC.1
MQVFVNTVDGRATAVAVLLQVLQYSAAQQQGSLRSAVGRLHGCAHFSRVMYYPAAALNRADYCNFLYQRKIVLHPRAKAIAGRWLKRFEYDDFFTKLTRPFDTEGSRLRK